MLPFMTGWIRKSRLVTPWCTETPPPSPRFFSQPLYPISPPPTPLPLFLRPISVVVGLLLSWFFMYVMCARWRHFMCCHRTELWVWLIRLCGDAPYVLFISCTRLGCRVRWCGLRSFCPVIYPSFFSSFLLLLFKIAIIYIFYIYTPWKFKVNPWDNL